jgi:DNA-binding NarL/FixJ family response regulator
MPIPIALAEDNAVNRNTFLQKVQHYPELNILFLSVDGDDCLKQLQGIPFTNHPEIIFVDLEMPNMNGVQTIQLGKAIYPHIHFIVLTVFDDDEKIFEAIKAGASGYLLKDENAASIRRAISTVLEQEGAAMSPAIARKALEMLSRADLQKEETPQVDELEELLSAREKCILHHTIQGLDAKRIGDLEGISVLTVRKHIANIYEKLHVNSKAQVMNLAHQRQWFK